ncbi:SirB1 [Edwardsiella piscicida C07-087]|nr:SirB1 [Edwardsiella piscicida C07-087]
MKQTINGLPLMAADDGMGMSVIADFAFDEALLSDGVLQMQHAVRPELDPVRLRAELDGLATQAQTALRGVYGEQARLQRLLTLFFGEWGFGGVSGVYRLSDALWLDTVLARRQGTPASLGIILQHIAQALALPLQAVVFPTQLLLRADWPQGGYRLINPLNGETLECALLAVWLKGHQGMQARMSSGDIEAADNSQVVRRLLTTLKAALMEEQQVELALNACEALLCFEPEDPYEIRDRGLLYARLECPHIALSDLNYFIEQCPEDPVAEVIKLQIHAIEQFEVVLH